MLLNRTLNVKSNVAPPVTVLGVTLVTLNPDMFASAGEIPSASVRPITARIIADSLSLRVVNVAISYPTPNKSIVAAKIPWQPEVLIFRNNPNLTTLQKA